MLTRTFNRQFTRLAGVRTYAAGAPKNSVHDTTTGQSSAAEMNEANPLESPRKSYTPLWLGLGAFAMIGGYYSISNRHPPQIGAVKAIERSMAPKTHGANVPGNTPLEGYQKRA